MYLPIPPDQPSCATAWREAVRAVLGHGGGAYNVILDVAAPTAGANLSDPVVSAVDHLLRKYDVKPIETVANTIFPRSLYKRHGAPLFYNRFLSNVLPAAGKNGAWSGYYFERMINMPRPAGGSFNQLHDIVDRIRDPAVKARNKFEISIFDPLRDTSRSPYGGQCLSHGSFKIRKSQDAEFLDLTAMYRNHYYVEKLLGNLIGLGRLMSFVAEETGLKVGSLTVISTHAVIDLPKSKAAGTATKAEIAKLLEQCDSLVANS